MVGLVVGNVILTGGLAFILDRSIDLRAQKIFFAAMLGLYIFWPAVLYSINIRLGASEINASVSAVLICGGFLLGVLWRHNILSSFSWAVQKTWIALSVGIALAYLSLESLYLSLVDPPKQQFLSMSAEASQLSLMGLSCFVVVIAPLIEEILFRGMLYRLLLKRSTRRQAILMSGLVFGLVHIEVPALIPLLVGLGWILGWLRQQSDSMVPPLVLHMVNNGLAMMLALSH